MKIKIRIIAGCLATVIMLCCALGCLASIMERKDSRAQFQEFYEQQQDFDVLILGTSHAYNGISPMDMWEQNGIVAYNMAVPGCRIATAYWILRNALQYTNPKLIVIDCAYLEDVKTSPNINFVHRALDSMPFTRIKIEAICDLYEEQNDIFRFLFPFSLYHNRWNELTRQDLFFEPQPGKMGFYSDCEVVDAQITEVIANEAVAVDTISTQYLKKIVELCMEKEIEVLFTFIPFLADEQSKNDAAFVKVLAEQYGIRYLGPTQLLEQINQKTDFSNSKEDNSHLNLSGCHKLSYYLGNYLAEHYSLPDRRQDQAYSVWHEYYQQYTQYKQKILTEQTSLQSYLVGAADRNNTVLVQIENKMFFEDKMFCNLLQNLGISADDFGKTGTLLTAQPAANDSYEIVHTNNGKTVCLHNNEVCHEWDHAKADADVFILIIENEKNQLLDAACFYLEESKNR